MFRILSTSCLILTALSSTLLSQAHLGSIRGIVRDPSGAVVADAGYRLISDATSRERIGRTGANGSFSVPQLEPGAYQLEIEVTGHKRSVSRTVVAVDQHRRLDVSLELGTVTEDVVVTAPELPLDRMSMGLGTVLDNRLVQSLPLGRA